MEKERNEYIYNWDLKKMIIEKGLRQNWMANKCMVDSAIFTKYITGERPCSPENKVIIAELLGCKIEDIFKDQ